MEKEITYKATRVFYRVFWGGYEKTILFLHGWGSDGHGFAHIEPFFVENYNCIFIDMPCFQKTDENPPAIPFELLDYKELVTKILDAEKIEKTNIIAHSFGARVAVLLVENNPHRFERLVLTGAAGIPPRFNFVTKTKILLYKLKRKLFKVMPKNSGSSDYRVLTTPGKVTFQNILRQDLRPNITRLNNPTLLIFGQHDKSTPVRMGKLWTKINAYTKLTIYKHCGHFCFIEQPERFILDAQNFIGQE